MPFLRTYKGGLINSAAIHVAERSDEDMWRLYDVQRVPLGEVFNDELDLLDQTVPAHPGTTIIVLRDHTPLDDIFGVDSVRTYRLPVVAWRLTAGWVMPVVPGCIFLEDLDWAIEMQPVRNGKDGLYQAPFAGSELYDWSTLMAEYLDYRRTIRQELEMQMRLDFGTAARAEVDHD